MTQPLHLRRPQRAVTKFSCLALVAGGAGLGLIALAGMLAPRLWQSERAGRRQGDAPRRTPPPARGDYPRAADPACCQLRPRPSSSR